MQRPAEAGETMSDFKEELHPRDKDGKFTDKNTDGQNKTEQNETVRQKKFLLKRKMTPAQKIASVHIDFNKDNILPELNADTLEKMGLKKNKPILVKTSSILRNLIRHPEVKKEDFDELISKCLYDSPDVMPGKNASNKYFSLIKFVHISKKKGTPTYGVLLLDVNETLENFDVVHWHWISAEKLKSLK